ncbi:MAG: glycosyltransferase family 4 protein [Cyanobacteria bacterium J06598_1]
MKIAVIGAKSMPPQQGGIEHVCAELYPRMVAAGHTVDFYTRASSTQQPQNKRQTYQGVRIISLPGINFKGLDAFSTSFLGALFAARGGYDVIHFHAIGPALFSAVVKLLSPKSKIVVTCHGLDWQRDKWGKLATKYLRAGEKASVRFADGIIVVSGNLKDYFWTTYQRESVYIPNAASRYAHSDQSFSFCHQLGLTPKRYIVFLGRLVPEKRPDLLIRAFEKLQPAGWRLAVVGTASDTSEYATHLKALAKDQPNIIFTGELRGPLLAEVMRGSGLFVLPSRLEGMPLALLEAMAEDIPVIASDIPPHQSLLEPDRGVLFKTDSLESCVCQLAWALNNPEQMSVLAKNASRFIQKNHTWEIATHQTLKLYETLIARPLDVSAYRFDSVSGQPASATNSVATYSETSNNK